MTLSQLDSLRRELLSTARNCLRQVDFGKVLRLCCLRGHCNDYLQ